MVNIKFGSLHIDKIANGAGVYYGRNIQVNWDKQTKKNEGAGTVAGSSNTLANNQTLVVKAKTDSNQG
jgi:hypothetical protein